MPYCVMCGSPIPADQGSKTCSMCYGDPDHGKGGILPRWSVDHRIFEHDGRFYQRFYSVGATEEQDERLTFLQHHPPRRRGRE